MQPTVVETFEFDPENCPTKGIVCISQRCMQTPQVSAT